MIVFNYTFIHIVIKITCLHFLILITHPNLIFWFNQTTVSSLAPFSQRAPTKPGGQRHWKRDDPCPSWRRVWRRFFFFPALPEGTQVPPLMQEWSRHARGSWHLAPVYSYQGIIYTVLCLSFLRIMALVWFSVKYRVKYEILVWRRYLCTATDERISCRSASAAVQTDVSTTRCAIAVPETRPPQHLSVVRNSHVEVVAIDDDLGWAHGRRGWDTLGGLYYTCNGFWTAYVVIWKPRDPTSRMHPRKATRLDAGATAGGTTV